MRHPYVVSPTTQRRIKTMLVITMTIAKKVRALGPASKVSQIMTNAAINKNTAPIRFIGFLCLI